MDSKQRRLLQIDDESRTGFIFPVRLCNGIKLQGGERFLAPPEQAFISGVKIIGFCVLKPHRVFKHLSVTAFKQGQKLCFGGDKCP